MAAMHLVDIMAIDPGSMDADQHLAVARNRNRSLGIFKMEGPVSGFNDLADFHGWHCHSR
jgi:hypothetical protein